MPHFHHKRRHTWPYCGSPANSTPRYYTPIFQGPVSVPVAVPATPAAPQAPHAPLNYHQFAVPLGTTDLNDPDDAASAGLVRPRHSFAQRFWFTPKGPIPVTNATTNTDTTSASSSRQVARPPLDKARSLFVLPTTSTVRTATGGNTTMVSYAVPSLPLTVYRPTVAVNTTQIGNGGYGYNYGYGYGHVPAGRRHHRRCHSERPRAWREPSASLWTLIEE